MNKQGASLSAAAGHVVDLYRLFRFEPRNPHSYSKYRQIKALAQRSGARVLVETGTYVGNTSMRCSRVFERVFTIELDPDLFRQASRYLASRGNVECLEGDALELLPQVLERADVSNALVFLDGHFSGPGTAHGGLAEPACKEIEVLAKHRDKITAFIVDDFRRFGRDEGWPNKIRITEGGRDLFRRRVRVHSSHGPSSSLAQPAGLIARSACRSRSNRGAAGGRSSGNTFPS